jgi:ribosome biogenesis GTPase
LASSLDSLGLTPELMAAIAPFEREGLVPGRIVAGHQKLHRVATAGGEVLAEVAGSLRHGARGAEQLPAVGDWVVLRPRAGEARALVQAVLPRRTAFVRRAAGERTVAQVLAANVDTAFLVMGLDGDFSPRRLERALVLAWESGAQPVVLLNKADLCHDVGGRRNEVERVAMSVPVRVIAARSSQGLEDLSPWLQPGRTVVLLGSSGVGKSTIVNRLLGRERQRTATFEDVTALGEGCRFRDCSHAAEPGCAVRAAVEDGRLDPERLDSYLRLTAELRALEVREDPLRRRAERARWRSIMKSMRGHTKGDG